MSRTPSGSSDPHEDITFRVEGQVGIIGLNRPHKLNAVRLQTLEELLTVLDDTKDDPGIGALLLRGEGRAFCSGQDLDELSQVLLSGAPDASEARAIIERFQEITRRLLSHPLPIVAAVHGVAVGFGSELMLGADIRIAASDARIGFVEAERGLFETNGALWLLPRIIGHGRASDMLLSAEMFDAAHAFHAGLVTRIVEPHELDASAIGLAQRVASNAPLAVGRTKRALLAGWTRDLEWSLAQEVEGVLECLASEDLREGLRAFEEHRAPNFRGR